MISNHNIFVEKISILAFGPDDRAAHEPSNFGLFGQRSQFVRTGMKYMGVALQLAKVSTGRRRATHSFRIEIINLTTSEVLSSRTRSVSIPAGENGCMLRVDVPLKSDMVHERYAYEVRVVSTRDNTTMASQGLSFRHAFRPRIEQCFLCPASSDERQREVNFSEIMEIDLCFELASDSVSSDMPEMTVSLCSTRTDLCLPTHIAEDNTNIVRCHIPLAELAGEGVTARLECLGTVAAEARLKVSDNTLSLCREDMAVEEESLPESNPDIDFDRLLDEFISSQLEEDKDPTPEQDCAPEATTEEEHRTAMSRLDELIGLDSVKSKTRSLYNISRFYRMRSAAGLSFRRPPLHALFLGAPGTGKTTVAKIMGQLLKEAGVLSKGHVVMRERSTIVGKYYGDEEKAVREAIEMSQGGILFIDEAYQLWREDDPKDPGRIALEAMMTALADPELRDWMVILAGYTVPTLKLLEANPGLASRIPPSNHYMFQDYNVEQLELIADKYLADNQYAISDEARVSLRRLLQHDYSCRDASFGNARHVMNLLETGILPAMAERVVGMASPQISDLKMITASDIPTPTIAQPRACRRLGFAV